MSGPEVRGDIYETHDAVGRPRWVYCCPVCGFHTRQWAALSAAQAAGMAHEERGLCVTYRSERLF